MMRSFLLALVLGGTFPGITLVGTVRDGASGAPIASARIELLDGRTATWTDSAGVYALRLASAGTHRIRVSRLGYESRLLEVFAGSDSLVRVDVALAAKPERLPRIAVRDTSRALAIAGDGGGGLHHAEPGARTLRGPELHQNPALAAADALQPLTTLPFVAASPESPTALQVRGGSSDQNLVLVDDVPVYSLSHAASALAAIDPDVVASVSLHAGVPPARYGRAASSIIVMRTEEAPLGRFSSRGALGPAEVRQMVAGRLRGTSGSFLLAGRRSLRGLGALAGGQTNRSAGFDDWFGKLSTPLGPGTLELLALGSRDRIAFDARVEPDAAGESHDGTGGVGDAAPGVATPQNAFNWSSRTQAAIWRVGIPESPHALVRAWRSTADAVVDWRALTGRAGLASAFLHEGVGALGAWRVAATDLTAGMDVERAQATYEVAVEPPTGGGVLLSRPGFGGGAPVAAPWVASIFVEGRWTWGDHWRLVGGVRDRLQLPVGQRIEPRLSLRYSPSSRVAFLAGYARTRQSIQSLRNDESLLNGLIGIPLPVAGSPGGLPEVSADQVTAGLVLQAGAGTVLSLDAYSRRLDGLVVTAPVTNEPFATDRAARGSGRARGLGLSLTRSAGPRVSGHAVYTLARTTREARGRQYRPWFDVTHSLATALAFRPTPALAFRTALTAAAGRPASVASGAVEWVPMALRNGAGEFAGSPRLAGSPGSGRLAPYLRVDIGARYAWHPRVFGAPGGLAATVSVNNVLGRANELGLLQTGDPARRQALPYQTRTLWLGLEWAY